MRKTFDWGGEFYVTLILLKGGNMNKKLWTVLAAVVLVAGLIIGLSFLPKGNNDEEGKNYNVIFTSTSIPPTLAAMDSILDGGQTYAYIERGKTYSGIDLLKNEGFTNLGFATSGSNAQNNDLTPAKIQEICDLVKRLKAEDKKATFNFYVADHHAYVGFAIGIYAGLKDEDYKVVMIEDGAATYEWFEDGFINGKSYSEGDDQPYKAFSDKLTEVKAKIQTMKDDAAGVLPGSQLVIRDLYAVYALATLPNAEYRIQDVSKITHALETSVGESRLTKIYKGTDEQYHVNIKSSSISQTMKKFNAKQKSKYLTLMFGADQEKASNMLQREVDGNGNPVSSKKLIYIGSRVTGYDYSLVPDLTVDNYDTYIVNYADLQTLAESDDFAKFLKTEYTEADWASLIALMQKNNKWIAAFNLFQEYRFSFSYVLDLYCEGKGAYDLLYKGHPSELVDNAATFDTRYKVGNEPYNAELFTLVNHFHFEDSLGKRIGVMPGGVAAENFAYLGLDFSICGLDSSTYTGYEPSVPVEFVLGGGSYSIYDTNVYGRYANGTLKDGKGEPTKILSKGNLLRLLKKEREYNNWLKTTFGISEADLGNYDLARTGLLEYSASHSSEDKTIKRNVSFGHYEGDTYKVDTTKTNVANGDFLSEVAPQFTGTVPAGYKFAGWAFVGQTSMWNSYFNTTEGDLQMYAVFSKIVELNSNYPTDKDNTKTDLTVYYNWGTKIAAAASLKYAVEGYTFAGWARTADATSAEFEDATVLPKANDVTTLYAVWKPVVAE